MTESVLHFVPKVDDMGKNLKCRAENPKLIASQIEDSWTLDINCKYRFIRGKFNSILTQEFFWGDPELTQKQRDSRKKIMATSLKIKDFKSVFILLEHKNINL